MSYILNLVSNILLNSIDIFINMHRYVTDPCNIYVFQSSVAEWLLRWGTLGVITTTELLGGRRLESHSQHEWDRVCIQGRNSNDFP